MKPLKLIKVVIEKTSTGFSAYAEKMPVYTTGGTMSELIDNLKEAFSLYYDDEEFDVSRIAVEMDLKQFFRYYRVINSKALAQRIKMNPTLLSQYIRGHKKPSARQQNRILYGIKEIGEELSDISLPYNPKINS